jgi:hypothetical protein
MASNDGSMHGRIWCWCARNKTDGDIPVATWNKQRPVKARAELIKAGLAEDHGDKIVMHDYLDHQRSADEIEELRNKRATAGSKGGKAKASATASARQKLKQTASKSVADSSDAFQASRESSPNDLGSSNATGREIARIVKLYVESSTAAGVPAPSESQDRVSKSARSLLDQGYPPEQVADAARNAAVGGWNDLAQQLQRDAARAKPTAVSALATADARYFAGTSLAETLERKAIG